MRQETYSYIIERIRNGDNSAMSELVNQSMNLAIHIANNILYNKADLEDTIQDIYIKIWENIDSYDESKGKFTSWFNRIVQNQCIDRNRNFRTYADENLSDKELDNSQDIDEKIYFSDLKNEILKIASKLPGKQSEIFQLRDIQNLSMKEVQEITGLSLGSIKTNLYLARKKIKELLGPDWKKL